MNCDQETTLAMLAFVLVISFLDRIDKNLPQLKLLFSNNTNLLLLCLLVVLVVVVNTPVGIMMLVVVAYIKNYYEEQSRRKVVNKIKFDKFSDIQEGPYQGTHVDSDVNVALTNKVGMDHKKELENLPIKCINKVELKEKKLDRFNFPANDFLTQKGLPDRGGFDIAGCRYDMVSMEQNLSKYGPPVSSYCAPKKGQCSGDAFYPLNG